MEGTKHYHTLDEFFEALEPNTQMTVSYGEDKRAKFGFTIQEIYDTKLVGSGNGHHYTIFIDAYDHNTQRLKIQVDNSSTILKGFRQMYSVQTVTEEDGETRDIAMSFNSQKIKEITDSEESKEKSQSEPYTDYLDSKSSNSTYTNLQRERVIDLRNDLADKLQSGTLKLNDGDDKKLTAKFFMYFYQSKFNDVKKDLIKYWDSVIKSNNNNQDVINNSLAESPKIEPMYDTNQVNRIRLTCTLDKNRTIYVNKGMEKTTTIKGLEVKAKSGHFFTDRNLIVNEEDATKNVCLHGKNGLLIESIFDLKISYTEDDPDAMGDESKPLTDQEIMELLNQNQDVVRFLERQPTFLDYLLSGKKKRGSRPVTKNTIDFFKGKVDSLKYSDGKNKNTNKNTTTIEIIDGGNEIPNGTYASNYNVSNMGNNIIFNLYSDDNTYVGKLFVNNKRKNIYDQESNKFLDDNVSGNVSLKDGRKIQVKAKLQ